MNNYRIAQYCLLLVLFIPFNLNALNVEKEIQASKSLIEQKQFDKARLLLEEAIQQLGQSQVEDQVRLMSEIAMTYLPQGNMDAMLETYHEIDTFCLNEQLPDLRARNAWQPLAEMNYMMGKADKCLYYNQLALAHFRMIKDEKEIADQLLQRGLAFNISSMPDSASLAIQEAILINREVDNPEKLKTCYFALSQTFSVQEEFHNAIEYSLKGVELGKQMNDSLYLCSQYILLGDIYTRIKNQPKRKAFFEKALAYAEALKLKRRTAQAKFFLANYYRDQGNRGKAEEYYNTALEYFKSRKNDQKAGDVLFALSTYALKDQDYDKAIQLLDESVLYYEKAEILERDKMKTLNRLSETYFYKKEFQKSEKLADQALAIAQSINNHAFIAGIKKRMAKIKVIQGDYKKAAILYDASILHQDSAYDIGQAELANELQARFDFDQKEQEIALLNAEGAMKDFELSQRNTIIWIGALALTILSFLLFYIIRLNKQKKRTAQEIAAKNKLLSKALGEKDLLLREIHHRVKNNLQVISSLLNLQSKSIEDEKALEAISEGRNRVRSMALIHQNLYQDENLTGVESKTYFERLVEELCDTYKVDLDKIHLDLQIQNINLDVDTMVPLGLIVNELVSNALKYAFKDKGQGRITVVLKEEQNQLVLEVNDNGQGIEVLENRPTRHSFGYKLINAFTTKLEGNLIVENNDGAKVRIEMTSYKKAA